MALNKAIPLVLFPAFSAPAYANEVCVLQRTCPEKQQCKTGEMMLEWQPGDSAKIWVDGKELDAAWSKAGDVMDEIRTADTTWTIVNTSDVIWASDGIVTVGIARDGQSSTVSATRMPLKANRYVDYEEAITQRQIFSGVCEGLF